MPTTTTRRPATDGDPNTAAAPARSAASTPRAVGPLDEPVPPCDSGRQNTLSVNEPQVHHVVRARADVRAAKICPAERGDQLTRVRERVGAE